MQFLCTYLIPVNLYNKTLYSVVRTFDFKLQAQKFYIIRSTFIITFLTKRFRQYHVNQSNVEIITTVIIIYLTPIIFGCEAILYLERVRRTLTGLHLLVVADKNQKPLIFCRAIFSCIPE